MPCRAHRLDDGLLVRATVLALLAPPGHDQQRVVDGDPEPDQGDEELDDEVDVGEVADGEHTQERGHDRDGRDHQRDEGHEGGEDEEQDDQGAEGAQQRLAQHAGWLATLGVGCVALGELEVAGRADVEPGALLLRREQVEGLAEGGDEGEPGEPLVHDDAVRRAAVVGDEAVRSGVALPRHAVLREVALDREEDPVHLGLLGGHSGAHRDGDGDDRRALVRAVAVDLQQLLLGLEALLPRQREVDREPVDRLARRDPSGGHDDQPEDTDERFAPQDESSEPHHGRTSLGVPPRPTTRSTVRQGSDRVPAAEAGRCLLQQAVVGWRVVDQ